MDCVENSVLFLKLSLGHSRFDYRLRPISPVRRNITKARNRYATHLLVRLVCSASIYHRVFRTEFLVALVASGTGDDRSDNPWQD